MFLNFGKSTQLREKEVQHIPLNYKPVILRLSGYRWINAYSLFFILVIITLPLSIYFKTPIVTALNVSYTAAVMMHLVKRYSKYLNQLRPVLQLNDEEFGIEEHNLSHFKRWVLIGGSILAPIGFIFTNINSESLNYVLSGGEITLSFIWGFVLAMVNWILIFQLITVVYSDMRQFRRLGLYKTNIKLLNTELLTPYSSVGISTMLIFVGSYVLIPIAYFDRPDLLIPAIRSLMITLPISIIILLLPILAIHRKIVKNKVEELSRLSLIINGNLDLLKHTYLSQEESYSRIDLLTYKEHIKKVFEWPIDNSGVFKLFLYLVIPVITWILSSFTDRLLDFIF